VQSTARAKQLSIETLRGLAIVLMVAGHVIGNDPSSGLRVADDSPYRYFYESLRLLRMPLFTAISGYVYALRPLSSTARFSGFLGGKARRLLLPMLTVGTIEFLAHALVPGVNHRADLRDLWRIYFFGYDHFWFLQAIFLVIAVSAALDALGALQTPWRLAVALFGAFVLARVLPPVELFSLSGALYLAPFFLLGVGLRRFEHLRSPLLSAACWLVFLHGIAQQQWAWFMHDAARVDPSSLLGMSTSLAGMVLVFAHRRSIPALAWLGTYAYSIYLFHILATAPARILTTKVLGDALPDPEPLILALSLAAGLAVPIVLDRLLRKHPVTALVFLGLRPAEVASEAPPDAASSARRRTIAERAAPEATRPALQPPRPALPSGKAG